MSTLFTRELSYDGAEWGWDKLAYLDVLALKGLMVVIFENTVHRKLAQEKFNIIVFKFNFNETCSFAPHMKKRKILSNNKN